MVAMVNIWLIWNINGCYGNCMVAMVNIWLICNINGFYGNSMVSIVTKCCCYGNLVIERSVGGLFNGGVLVFVAHLNSDHGVNVKTRQLLYFNDLYGHLNRRATE